MYSVLTNKIEQLEKEVFEMRSLLREIHAEYSGQVDIQSCAKASPICHSYTHKSWCFWEKLCEFKEDKND